MTARRQDRSADSPARQPVPRRAIAWSSPALDMALGMLDSLGGPDALTDLRRLEPEQYSAVIAQFLAALGPNAARLVRAAGRAWRRGARPPQTYVVVRDGKPVGFASGRRPRPSPPLIRRVARARAPRSRSGHRRGERRSRDQDGDSSDPEPPPRRRSRLKVRR